VGEIPTERQARELAREQDISLSEAMPRKDGGRSNERPPVNWHADREKR
jgi:hypothetical protein